jgi:hypothetical protein
MRRQRRRNDTLKSEIDGLGSGTFPFATTQSATVTVKPGLEIKTEEVARPKWWVEGKLLVGSEALAETTTLRCVRPQRPGSRIRIAS